jgi:hypothetical protein
MSSSPEASTDSNEPHIPALNNHSEKHAGETASEPKELPEELNIRTGNGGAHEEHDDEEEESDEEDEVESEEDEDEEDEDEEPALKYERIGGSLNDLLKKDSAASLAISNRTMVRPIALAYRGSIF